MTSWQCHVLLPGMGFWLLCRVEEPCCLLLTPITHLTSITSPSTTPSDQKRSPAPSAAFPAQRRAVLRSLLQASPFCATLPLVARKDGNRSMGFTQAMLLLRLRGSLGGRGRSSPPPVLALQPHTRTVRASWVSDGHAGPGQSPPGALWASPRPSWWMELAAWRFSHVQKSARHRRRHR